MIWIVIMVLMMIMLSKQRIKCMGGQDGGVNIRAFPVDLKIPSNGVHGKFPNTGILSQIMQFLLNVMAKRAKEVAYPRVKG